MISVAKKKKGILGSKIKNRFLRFHRRKGSKPNGAESEPETERIDNGDDLLIIFIGMGRKEEVEVSRMQGSHRTKSRAVSCVPIRSVQ